MMNLQYDFVIVLWADGRIGYEIRDEKLFVIAEKINQKFNGGGRQLVGGATYPGGVSETNRKECFDEIVEVLRS